MEIATETQDSFYVFENLEWDNEYFWTVIPKNATESLSFERRSFRILPEISRYSLHIGINKYQDGVSNLLFPVNDASDTITVVQKFDSGFISDTCSDTVLFEDFESSLKKYYENSRSGDVFIFYFSGHGGIELREGEEEESYLFLSDFKKVYVSDLKNLLDNITGKKIVIIDACHSGGFTDLSNKNGIEKVRETEKSFNNSVINVFFPQSISLNKEIQNSPEEYFVITGSSTSSLSYEPLILQNGVMTFFFCDGLGHTGENSPLASFDFTYDADLDFDGKILFSELGDYVVSKVGTFMQKYSLFQDVQYHPKDSSLILCENFSKSEK